MHTVDVSDNATLAAVDRGNRPPLLLVHGFPLDHEVWQAQIGAFEDQRRVIAPDLVGFGASSPEGRSSLDRHADDLAALLDDRGIERAVVVGLSMGGYVALSMWRQHPSRMAGLVLVASRAGGDVEANRAARYQMSIAVKDKGVGPIADALLPRMLSEDAAPETREALREMMHRQPADGVVAALRAMAARPDSGPDLPTVDVPTLIVTGDEDAIISVASSEAMAAAIPNAELKVVPGAGHIVNMEEPGAFNALLRSFLERVDAR
ncbi:MAG: alpha/beta fold hydrolase [Anaerolineae bacterium]